MVNDRDWWYDLASEQFPEQADTFEYLKDEPRRTVILNGAIAFGRAPSSARLEVVASVGSEAEFLQAAGHRRRPIGSRKP